MVKNNYNANSIQTLDPLEHMRKYPGMYVGSKDAHGLLHCVKEIISNSIDEFLNGSGSEVTVKINKDGSIYIKDNGRGIPHGEHEPGVSTLQACFGIANTGGKFNNATGETGYNTSGGEHGTGGKAVNALSKKMIVSTAREGIKETVEFAKGKFIKRKEVKSSEQGVEVTFYPDSTIFETVEFDSEAIEKMIREFSFLCKGLTFTFIDEIKDKNEIYCSNRGLYDFFEYLNGDKETLTEAFYFEKQEGQYQVEIAFGYNKSYSSIVKLYTNNIPQESGTHLTGFRTAFTSYMNNYAREKGWLKEKEENLTGGDYAEGQMLIINFKMIDPVFRGQNKEELTSSEGRTYVQKFTNAGLLEAFAFRENDVKAFFDKAIAARRAREAAKKAKDAERGLNKKEKGLKGKLQLSNKFIDCVSKNPKERNLLLVEGLSAGSSAVEARNAKTDCIYMLRGKIISPLKTTKTKILQNQEMSDIIRVIGGGFGNDEFDLSKMNFDKIVMTTDADSDGADIELLLITFFFTYMRPLVEAGKLYRAVTPLYIVRKGKEELYFYSEEEMNDFKAQNKSGYDVLRAKGLGELNAEDLHKVCFENQRFKRITVSDGEKAKMLLEILQGENVSLRKKYIYENAERLGFEFD